MIIYKIQNKINGKIYIGQTKKSLYKRISEHLCNKSYIGNALRKYGIECFDISIIDTADTKEWLNDKEMEYIAFYDCKHPNGYNLTDGGEGGDTTAGIPRSEETKQKVREKLIGQKRTEEQKERIRKGGMTNKHHQEKTLQKMRGPRPKTKEKMKGCIPWNKGLTKETDKRMAKVSKSLKESSSLGVWKKGQKPWNLGMKNYMSEKGRNNISIANKNKIISKQELEKRRESAKKSWKIRKQKEFQNDNFYRNT